MAAREQGSKGARERGSEGAGQQGSEAAGQRLDIAPDGWESTDDRSCFCSQNNSSDTEPLEGKRAASPL